MLVGLGSFQVASPIPADLFSSNAFAHPWKSVLSILTFYKSNPEPSNFLNATPTLADVSTMVKDGIQNRQKTKLARIQSGRLSNGDPERMQRLL